jgi:CRISPR-associated endoribonuclease Cas6
MLIQSTWILSTSTPIALPRTYGLELVKELHRRMGLDMGNDPIPKVSYAGITGNYSTIQDFLNFHPGEFYQLSLCGLEETTSKAIAHLTLDPTLEFLGATFQVCDRQDQISSYDQIYHRLVASEPEPPKRFDLKFTTPTAFSQGRTYLPLPVPTLMFRSWLERWNTFAPVYLGSDELIDYLSNSIVLTRHRLQSRSFQVHSSRIQGFTGEVRLQSLNRIDPLVANVANLLIHYGEFSGTGIKTRLGMGKTQLVPDLSQPEPPEGEDTL